MKRDFVEFHGLTGRRSYNFKESREYLGGLAKKVQELAKDEANWTAEKRAQWDRLNSEYDDLLAEIETEEKRFQTKCKAGEKEFLAEQRKRPDWEFIDGKNPWRAMTCDEELFDERGRTQRALRPDESLTEALSCRDESSADFERAGLTLGKFIRATIVGARSEVERRALSEGTDSAGGYAVPTLLAAQTIDALRSKTVCLAAGAEIIPLFSDTNDFAKLATDAAPTWRAENAAVNVDDPTFSRVQFKPFTLAVLIRASRELLEDSPNVDQMIRTSLANSFSVELDRVCLVGAGTTEPLGLFGMANVTEVDMGTNGAALSGWDNLVTAVGALEDANVMVPSDAAIVMAPRTKTAFGAMKDSNGAYLTPPAALAGMRFLATTGVPIDQTQGGASDASSIFLGDWSQLKIGIRTQMRIEVLRERFADNYQYGILCALRADVQCFHEESMCRIIGVIPA